METEATINFQGFNQAGKICRNYLTTDDRLKLLLSSNEFKPTEIVKGKVIFDVDAPIKAREIRLEVVGKSKTSFFVTNKITSKNTTMDRTHYYYTIPYINDKKVFWKAENDSATLAAKAYEFPFEFAIPEDVPPSMDKGQGKVKYYVKAIVEVPWGGINSETTVEITVLPFLDLNSYKRLDEPATGKIEKHRLFSSKQLNAKVRIPKIGYAPGDVISLKIEILNESSQEITGVQTGIHETYSFKGSDDGTKSGYQKSITMTRDLAVATTPLTVEKNKKTEVTIPFVVPDIPPTLEACDNISLEYDVFAEIQTSAYINSTAKTSVPIVVGTVALKSGNNK